MQVVDDKIFFTNEVLKQADGLKRFALSLCHNQHNAEDLVSETVLKAYQNFSSIKDHTKIKSWLYKILYNQFVSMHRKSSRMKQVDLSERDGDNFSLFENLTATGIEDPEKIFLQKLTAASVQKAIEELPLIFKQALVLSDMEQFSYNEISKILDIPVGTVRSRIARARQQLEKSLWQLALGMGIVNKLTSGKKYVCTCGKEESTIHQHEA
jgi:RNA polymerase sigma-70 factor (ECF subfamily)